MRIFRQLIFKIERIFLKFHLRKKRKKLSTLTLIELLVVIAIIGLIATLLIAQINSVQAKARDSRRIADLRAFAEVMELYQNDFGHYPIYDTAICTNDPNNPLAAIENYISRVPTDPLEKTQCYIYKTSEEGRNFKIQTKLERNPELMANDGGTDPDFYEVFSIGQEGTTTEIDHSVAMAIYSNWQTYSDATVVGDWQFNEGSGQIATDSSGYNNDSQLGSSSGSDSSDPDWQSGGNCKKGSCLEFDGNDDFLETPGGSDMNFTNQITVEGWVKYKNLNGMPRVIQKFASFWLYFDSDYNELRAGFKDKDNIEHDFVYSIIPTVNTWYHLAWTYDGQKVRLFINGQLDKEYTVDRWGFNIAGKKVFNSQNKLHFAQKSDNSGFLNGLIDELRIYNRALSICEICQRCQKNASASECNNCLKCQ